MVTGFGKPNIQKSFWNSLPQALLVLLLAGGIVQLTYMTALTLYKHVETSQKASSKQQEIEDLNNQIAVLKERTNQAKADRAYLERLARKQGFVKRGETVIVSKGR
ncbi:MAG: FtsB family cell division protein [Deinococcales bacterium]